MRWISVVTQYSTRIGGSLNKSYQPRGWPGHHGINRLTISNEFRIGVHDAFTLRQRCVHAAFTLIFYRKWARVTPNAGCALSADWVHAFLCMLCSRTLWSRINSNKFTSMNVGDRQCKSLIVRWKSVIVSASSLHRQWTIYVDRQMQVSVIVSANRWSSVSSRWSSVQVAWSSVHSQKKTRQWKSVIVSASRWSSRESRWSSVKVGDRQCKSVIVSASRWSYSAIIVDRQCNFRWSSVTHSGGWYDQC